MGEEEGGRVGGSSKMVLFLGTAAPIQGQGMSAVKEPAAGSSPLVQDLQPKLSEVLA